MKLKKILLGTVVVLGVAGVGGWFSLDKETRGLLATLPTNPDVLFWSQPQRDAAFRALDRLPVLAKSHVVPASGTPSPLPTGAPLKLPTDVDAYMAGQHSAALLVVHDGKLRLERYGLGFDASGRWTSFSVAKSFTSTLVGAAVKDGFIKSLDRQGQPLHSRPQGLGLRRGERAPAADHDFGREVDRRLQRPQLGRGPVQQAQARGRHGGAGGLHAQAAARSTRR